MTEDSSYSRIVKKHENLKRLLQDSSKNGETATNTGKEIYDKFSEINFFNPEADKFEKGYKPEKLEAKVEAYEAKAPIAEEKPAEQQVKQEPSQITEYLPQTELEATVEKEPEKAPEQQPEQLNQEQAEKVYLTIEEIAKLPGSHAIGYLNTGHLVHFKNNHKDLVKKNDEKKRGFNFDQNKNFYELNHTLLKDALKEYNEEKAEDIIKNHKKYIAETEEKNLADLIRRIEAGDEEIFLTQAELALIKGARGFCDLKSQVLLKGGDEKNCRKRKVKVNQTNGPNPREYRFAPELADKIFTDKKVIAYIRSAYEKRNLQKSLLEDEVIFDGLYASVEAMTDEEFFDFFKDAEADNPDDAKGKQHTNVVVLSKKVKYNEKEYEIKYVFKPTYVQDKDRDVGTRTKSERLSQISQTLNDVCASIVDEEFDFGLFEKTKIRKHPVEGNSSFRRYIDPFMSMHEIYEQENMDEIISNAEEGINNRKAFRYIINEIDCNKQNWGVQIGKDEKKKIKIVDISQSFGIKHNDYDNKLNSIKKTPELKEKIMKVDESELKRKLEKATEEFTDFSEQIEGCVKRIRELKKYLSEE